MLGRTHFLVGVCLATYFSDPLAWILIIIGSLLPDLDSSTSYLGRRFKIIGKTFEHRGFFHSLFLFIPLVLLASSFSYMYGLAIFLGVGSHLLLDSWTKQGLRIYSFSYRIRGPFKVGGFLEKLLFLSLIFFLLLRLI